MCEVAAGLSAGTGASVSEAVLMSLLGMHAAD